MAQLFDEEQMIESNILKFDERLSSPVVRFIDQTPSFVTYYHINNDESTSDEGFGDAETIVGKKSPIKFQRIDKLPVYGIEQIVVQLEDQEEGLDIEYDGEGIVAPNSVKPLPNDYFVIPYVGENYIFRVTAITLDNIRADNFYKFSFKLEYNDAEKRHDLENQVHDKYTCIMSNIGTENKCIIQQDFKERLDQIDAMYSDMVSLYLSIFLNERYNCLLSDFYEGSQIFDPFMSEFINAHNLFNKKNSTKTIYIETQFNDPKRKLKYERSIYRFVERRDINLIKPFFYSVFRGMNNRETLFYRWLDENIKIIDIPAVIDEEHCYRILSDVSVESCRLNAVPKTKYMALFQKFVRGEHVDIYDIDLHLNDELIQLDANLEMFFMTPILLYIIKEVIAEFHKTGIANPKKEQPK